MFSAIHRRPTVTPTQQEKITAALSLDLKRKQPGVQIGGRFIRDDENLLHRTAGPYIWVISLARTLRACEECTDDANWGV